MRSTRNALVWNLRGGWGLGGGAAAAALAAERCLQSLLAVTGGASRSSSTNPLCWLSSGMGFVQGCSAPVAAKCHWEGAGEVLKGGEGSAQQFRGSFPGCRRMLAVSEHSVRELG